MTVVQELGQGVRDEAVVYRGGEEPFLRIPRKVRPYLQRGTSKQGGELGFVHVR